MIISQQVLVFGERQQRDCGLGGFKTADCVDLAERKGAAVVGGDTSSCNLCRLCGAVGVGLGAQGLQTRWVGGESVQKARVCGGRVGRGCGISEKGLQRWHGDSHWAIRYISNGTTGQTRAEG